MNISNDREANTLVYATVTTALIMAYINDGLLACACVIGIIVSYTILEIAYRMLLGIDLQRDL